MIDITSILIRKLLHTSINDIDGHTNSLIDVINRHCSLFLSDDSSGITYCDFLILGVCFVFLIWRICAFLKRVSHKARLREGAIIILLSGYIIYYVGFYYYGTASSLFALIARPLIASLGMFVANTTYQELCSECTHSSVYMSIFGIIHILAIAVSAIFIVHFLRARLLSLYRRVTWRFKKRSSATINIFFGFNSPSIELAKSINEREERIVFVDMPSKDDNRKTNISLGEIFGLFPYKREFINQLNGVNYVLMNADYNTANETLADENFFENIDVCSVRGYIRRANNIRLFFLSDNESENIQSIINIQKDKIFNYNSDKRIDIYCHARRNEINLAFENIKFDNEAGLSVHIVDTSYLTVRWLKQQTGYLPVNYVTPNKNGTVDTPFNALIIGFGEIGQEILSFLYEFGAFPNSQHKRSPFCCYIVDRKMDEIRNGFYLKHPALINHREEIILTDNNDQKPNYDTWLCDVIKTTNYLVVATGADEENIKMAVDLYELALKQRPLIDDFSIYVHVSQKQQTRLIYKIMEKYHIPKRHIIPFGGFDKIFSYNNIIVDEVYTNAIQYKEMYDKAYNCFVSVSETEIGGSPKDEPFMAKLFKERREENQNISNLLHAETKFRLLGLNSELIRHILSSDNLNDQEKKTKVEIEAICNYSHSESSEQADRFLYCKDLDRIKAGSIEEKMYNIALCEHLRWNAAHEMMGYTKGIAKNEIRKEHHCLDDWNNLSNFKPPYDMRDLDFLVLETSFKQFFV